MLTWDDIRAIDAITDPLGVVSIYADRPDDGSGRLVRAVSLAGELRRLETDLAADGEAVAAYRRRMQEVRPALARMLEGRAPGRALFVPLSTGEALEVAVGMPVGMAVVVEETAYVRPLVAAVDEGRPAGVIVDDGPSLRLLAWRMGVIEEVGTYRSSARPGTRPARALAHEVRTAARERGWTRVVVAGSSRLAHTLARSATPPDGEVAVFTRSVSGVGPRGLATALGSALSEAQRRYEWKLVERVLSAGLSDQRRRARPGQDTPCAGSAAGQAPAHRRRPRAPLAGGPGARAEPLARPRPGRGADRAGAAQRRGHHAGRGAGAEAARSGRGPRGDPALSGGPCGSPEVLGGVATRLPEAPALRPGRRCCAGPEGGPRPARRLRRPPHRPRAPG